MNLSIKKRIHWSFAVLMIIFIINGIITIVTLGYNKKLSGHISSVVDPSLQSINELNKYLIESRMFTTNWVFLPYDSQSKSDLKKLQDHEFPALKINLVSLSEMWYDRSMADSLKILVKDFEQVLSNEKQMMPLLQHFEDYDDPAKKLGAEDKLKNSIIPDSYKLSLLTNRILKYEQAIRTKEQEELEYLSWMLQTLIIILSVTIIGVGVFLSIYLANIIIRLINKIRSIINDLSHGIIMKVHYHASGDEMGEMIKSVNNLSDKLEITALFANEIGNRNFNAHYDLLSIGDILGKALISMRDNLKLSDERLNEAQHIAHLGNFEIDLLTNDTIWSDEVYNIFGFNKNDLAPSAETFLSFVHPDDSAKAKNNVEQAFLNLRDSFFDFRFIRKNGSVGHGYTEWKFGFNEMRNPIRLYGILIDITVSKEAEEVLRISNAQLQKSNHELDKFVYSVSHDLRAPLLSMQGIVSLTAQETREELTAEHMQMLHGSINRLDKLIGEILEYSRNSRTDVKHEIIDFKLLLEEVTHELKFKTPKPVEIKIDIDGNETLYSDKERISVVLNNLVSNAINYHNPKIENPFVKISVTTDNYRSLIEVEDNGVGIRKEFHQKIFEMFYRGSENSIGSGLGLYIVKETMEKLHGDICIESMEGTGTKFILTIPNLFYQ